MVRKLLPSEPVVAVDDGSQHVTTAGSYRVVVAARSKLRRTSRYARVLCILINQVVPLLKSVIANGVPIDLEFGGQGKQLLWLLLQWT